MNITRETCIANYTTSMKWDRVCSLRSFKPLRYRIADGGSNAFCLQYTDAASMSFVDNKLTAWEGQNGKSKRSRLVKNNWSLI